MITLNGGVQWSEFNLKLFPIETLYINHCVIHEKANEYKTVNLHSDMIEFNITLKCIWLTVLAEV